MMNPIEEREIFTLAPGQKRTLSEWIAAPAYAPGTYEVRLRYTNDPTKAARKAPASPAVLARLAKTSACEVTSAPLTIKVP